jgi:hypothetical protein
VFAKPFVESVRVVLSEILYRTDAEVPEIHGNRFTDAGDRPEFFQNIVLSGPHSENIDDF